MRRSSSLPAEAGAVLLPLARAAIARRFGIALPEDDRAPWLAESGACFVTVTTGGRLHGCIGSLEPRRALLADVRGNAWSAAFADPRFTPLTEREFADTRLEVSVLAPAVTLEAADEREARARLRPGVDGVILECAGRRATYLPQVWEALPDPGDFLASLKRKAGLPADYWSSGIRLSTYAVAAFHEIARRSWVHPDAGAEVGRGAAPPATPDGERAR